MPPKYYRKDGKRTGTRAKNNTDLPFVIHSVNEACIYPAWWGDWGKTIKIVSIDPGITHFCLRIEERTGGIFKTVKLIKTNLGDRSSLINKKVSNDMKLCTVDVNQKTSDEKNVCHEAFDKPMRVYGRLTKLLDSMRIELLSADLVIIESQLKINYKMTRLGQHIIGYFIQLSIDNPLPFLLVEVDSKLKSRLAEKKPDDVKKWAVEYARKLAESAGDVEGLKLLNTRGKTNDFADTLIQIEAFLQFVRKPIS